MCDTCGCGQPNESVAIRKPDEMIEKEHAHDDERHHHHNEHGETRSVAIERDVLAQNDLIAQDNRHFLQGKGIFALNLVSSPGSGKTTLLEKTITALKREIPFAAIEGDQQTVRDKERIQETGVPVIQINTGTGCHLDARMIHRAIKELPLQKGSLLMIENVGNLVCPALFDLGEAHKVVIISVTEGDDKPHKYPTMFDVADVCIINKIDLLPYVDFDMEQCKQYALQVNDELEFMEVSAKTGTGMDAWYNWLRHQAHHHTHG